MIPCCKDRQECYSCKLWSRFELFVGNVEILELLPEFVTSKSQILQELRKPKWNKTAMCLSCNEWCLILEIFFDFAVLLITNIWESAFYSVIEHQYLGQSANPILDCLIGMYVDQPTEVSNRESWQIQPHSSMLRYNSQLYQFEPHTFLIDIGHI